MKANYYLFSIYVNKDGESEFESPFYVNIGTRPVWESEQRLDDEYSDEDRAELDEVLDGWLDEATESTFEPREPTTERELRARLIAAGFVEDPAFDAFINRHSDGE